MNPKVPVGPLFTDLYELTMAAGYFRHHPSVTASFTLFVRDCPERNYFVAAGLEDVLTGLESFRFSASDLEYLKTIGLFPEDFLHYLEKFRFNGQVWALPEGTLFFPDEPILEVTGPIIDAQIVETFLLNTIGFQTLIASKAARCVHAANGRPLIDFSLRRTQGIDAGMAVARSTYLVGFSATSNVLAGKRNGIPVSGTMAHSFVSAFEHEQEAFAAYAQLFPEQSVFLIDTYDTIEGARRAIRVALEMKERGKSLVGVRLDSGDMVALSRQVRAMFDEAGLEDVKIFASSGFDEVSITRALAQGARIDAFGVGTKMGVSADSPFLDIVYKMVRFGGRNVRKRSPGKRMLAGEKQVFRTVGRDGFFLEDVIGVRNEIVQGAQALLEKVMENGRRVDKRPSLESIRDRFRSQFAALPAPIKEIDTKVDYPVHISESLDAVQREADALTP